MSMRLIWMFVLVACLIGGALLASESKVDAIPLSTLVGGNGMIQQGNTLFSHFVFSRDDLGGNPPPVDANGIEVESMAVQGPDGLRQGLRFTGPFVANNSTNEFTGATVGIGFHVDVTDGSLLNAAHVSVDQASFTGEGAALLLVGSDRFQVGHAFTAADPASSVIADAFLSSKVSSERIIAALAFATGGFQGQPSVGAATIGSLGISFSQLQEENGNTIPVPFAAQPTSTSSIPEPSSLLLVFSGTMVLGFWRWFIAAILQH
jgi:hypothetical protein